MKGISKKTSVFLIVALCNFIQSGSGFDPVKIKCYECGTGDFRTSQEGCSSDRATWKQVNCTKAPSCKTNLVITIKSSRNTSRYFRACGDFDAATCSAGEEKQTGPKIYKNCACQREDLCNNGEGPEGLGELPGLHCHACGGKRDACPPLNRLKEAELIRCDNGERADFKHNGVCESIQKIDTGEVILDCLPAWQRKYHEKSCRKENGLRTCYCSYPDGCNVIDIPKEESESTTSVASLSNDLRLFPLVICLIVAETTIDKSIGY